jgi:hypothetical protein
MGIGKRRDAILVSLETPDYRRILKQYYDRSAGGAIILQAHTDVDSDRVASSISLPRRER